MTRTLPKPVLLDAGRGRQAITSLVEALLVIERLPVLVRSKEHFIRADSSLRWAEQTGADADIAKATNDFRHALELEHMSREK